MSFPQKMLCVVVVVTLPERAQQVKKAIREMASEPSIIKEVEITGEEMIHVADELVEMVKKGEIVWADGSQIIGPDGQVAKPGITR